MEEVAVRTEHEVVMEVEDTCMLIVVGARGIFGQQLKPCLILLFNIIILVTFLHYKL
jgi:hypothetical protein